MAARFVKELQNGSNWYHETVFNRREPVEINIYEFDTADFDWSINLVSNKKLAGGKAVSLKQAQYLADQAIKANVGLY